MPLDISFSSINAKLRFMLNRPLSIEDLEDRQLLSGASQDAAPPTASAAQLPAPVSTPDSTGSGSSVADTKSATWQSPAPSMTNAASSSSGASPSSGASSAAAGPSEDQLSSMAEYANQRPNDASNANYGPYASYADLQRMLIEAAGVAQSIADGTTVAGRDYSQQANPLLPGPADVTVVAASAPQSAGRGLHEPGEGIEPRAAAQPRADPVEAAVPFAAEMGNELRAASETPDNDEIVTEKAAAQANACLPAQPLLAGILRVDLPALEAGVERFFAQLEELGDELSDPDVAWRIGAWFLTAAGAAAALEFARAEAKDNRPREPLLVGGWRLPQPPRPKERPKELPV